MRKCIGCMESRPKKELVRIVSDGEKLILDLSGKANGRGAYLCADPKCLEKALKKNAFQRNLGMSLGEDQKAEFSKALESAAAGRME